MIRMMQMVPNGSAAVLRYAMATVLRKLNVTNIGPQREIPSRTLGPERTPPLAVRFAATGRRCRR